MILRWLFVISFAHAAFGSRLLRIAGVRPLDPDVGRTIPEYIRSRGFISETHVTTTRDGYILTFHRIIHPHLNRTLLKRPIILQHGIISSGIDWLNNAPGGCIDEDINGTLVGNNLGFELAKRGYDVWLPNSRGNAYSGRHAWLSPDSMQYWDFTFDSMIAYDLPTTLDYILNVTGHANIGYVGHSQGTLIMFGLLSTQPKYNQMIKPFIALSPVTTLGYMESPLRYLAPASRFFVVQKLTKWLGGFLRPSRIFDFLKGIVCRTKITKPICSNLIFMLTGYNIEQMNKTRIQVYVSNAPAGISAKNLLHYAQGIKSRRFQMYDHGESENMERYSSPKPPQYPLSNITNQHIALFSSTNDWLAQQHDVTRLRRALKVPLIDDYLVPNKKWNHIDYIWGRDVGTLINTRVLSLLGRYD